MAKGRNPADVRIAQSTNQIRELANRADTPKETRLKLIAACHTIDSLVDFYGIRHRRRLPQPPAPANTRHAASHGKDERISWTGGR